MKDSTASHASRGFRIHTFVFMVGMFVMGLANLSSGAPYWVGWVLLGWGAGLLAHGLAVKGHRARNPEE